MHIARLGRGRLQNAGDGGAPAAATCGAGEGRDSGGCSGHDGWSDWSRNVSVS